MSLKAANALGLKPTRTQVGYGAGGQHNNPVFFASFEVQIRDPKTNTQTAIGWDQEVLGIPDLELCREVTYGGQLMEVIGLLGRDVLRHCKMTYDGTTGRLDFEFNLASLQIRPSR